MKTAHGLMLAPLLLALAGPALAQPRKPPPAPPETPTDSTAPVPPAPPAPPAPPPEPPPRCVGEPPAGAPTGRGPIPQPRGRQAPW